MTAKEEKELRQQITDLNSCLLDQKDHINALSNQIERAKKVAEDLIQMATHSHNCNVMTTFQQLPCNCKISEVKKEIEKL